MTPIRHVLVTLHLPVEVQAVLRAAFEIDYAPDLALDSADATTRLQHADALVVSATKDRLDAPLIASLPSDIRGIATYSIGHEHIDLEAARKRNIAVFATPDVLSDACAEVGMLLLLGAARRVTESIALLRSGRWSGWSPTQLNGNGLSGKALGIIGMGRIGRAVAHRAKAFGMSIHYANRSRLAPALEDGAMHHANAEDMLRVSQFLLLACPVTPATRGFIDARRLQLLPRGAIVANIGRGALVIDADLVAALTSGHVAAAGLDVFDGEPDIFPGYHDLPNVFMLPHIGSSTIEARIAMGDIVVEGLRQFNAGAVPTNRIA
ncbi:MAG: D-glycerate dehydrogenase [Betaproteobacteria bacterium]